MQNCAIDYYPASFATSGPALMGLNAANEGFLDGFMRHATVDTLVCHVRTEEELGHFRNRLERLGLSGRRHGWVYNGDIGGLAKVGALLHPAPGFGPLAWVRRFGSGRAYSLCGITHTTAGECVMDSIGNLLVAPVQPWDAVICTSTVVRRTYERVLADWSDYLRDRYGIRPEPAVQLPVIPLGVDTDRFARSEETARAGRAFRERLGAGPADIAVLWVGRLDPLTKTHPLPSYLALERMAQRLGRQGCKVFFIQAGWFTGDSVSQAYFQAARLYAPSVSHAFVDGREPDIRKAVWFAADIFLSLSDNIQETFGLTPIEAMAAGLPVVVSDWDGYRDTVRDGVDGFRIPTWMPAEGNGEDVAQAFAAGAMPYIAYTGVTCQSIGVDIRACAEALVRLAEDPGLRRRMGAAGAERAVSVFDWRCVIAAYQRLWAELARIRDDAAMVAPRPANAPAYPLRGDPFGIFGSYPTFSLDDDSVLQAAAFVPSEGVEALRQNALNNFAIPYLAGAEDCRAVLERLGRGPASLAELVGPRQGIEAAMLRRTVSWLAKMGLAEILRPDRDEASGEGAEAAGPSR